MNKILAFVLFNILLLSCDTFAKNGSQIDSPHGVFVVTDKSVTQIHTVGSKDKDGDYEIKLYNIKSIYSAFKEGELASIGWWYPSSQQIYVQQLLKAIGGSQCQWWGDANWSYSFKTINLNISGKIVNAYKESENFKQKRIPKRTCNNYRFYTDNCERVRCNNWVAPKADTYLIRSKEDALNYFHKITKK